MSFKGYQKVHELYYIGKRFTVAQGYRPSIGQGVLVLKKVTAHVPPLKLLWM